MLLLEDETSKSPFVYITVIEGNAVSLLVFFLIEFLEYGGLLRSSVPHHHCCITLYTP